MKVGMKVGTDNPVRGADVALAHSHWVVCSPFHPMKRLNTGDWSVQLRSRRSKFTTTPENVQAQLCSKFTFKMQAEKFPDVASPEVQKSDESGSDSSDTTSQSVNVPSKRKAKCQGKDKRSKKVAIEPAAAVTISFTCQ